MAIFFTNRKVTEKGKRETRIQLGECRISGFLSKMIVDFITIQKRHQTVDSL